MENFFDNAFVCLMRITLLILFISFWILVPMKVYEEYEKIKYNDFFDSTCRCEK